MRTQHFFVPILDISEALPFAVRPTKTIKKNMEEQERARKELDRFVTILEKNFKEKIFYMGMDVIGEKSYERFIFEKGGFFEVMVENPIAMNAHFVHKKRAKVFKNALKKTLEAIMPRNSMTKMFLDSIEVQDEGDAILTVHEWHEIQNVRKSK